MKGSKRGIQLLLCGVLLGCIACGGRERHATQGSGTPVAVSYAELFRVVQHPQYKEVEVLDPWDSTQVLRRYFLVPRDLTLSEELPAREVIRVPLQRVAAYSSIHCGMMEELGVVDRIVGVCEPQYIELPSIRQGVASGRIADLGQAASPDVERLMTLAPEAIFVSPFKNVGYGRMETCGIPLIECVDYMESTPLGRAEWIRFMGLFFDRDSRADSLFAVTQSAYDSLRGLAASVAYRPTVLTEKRYAGVWYVPAGGSYIGHLLQDAGADYLWRDAPQSGSLPLSFETVFARGAEADFWLIKYNDPWELTYPTLKKEDGLYTRFAPFKKHTIFVCHTGRVPYYEESPLHPDRLLRDLMGIFHPELLPDHTPRYFTPMHE